MIDGMVDTGLRVSGVQDVGAVPRMLNDLAGSDPAARATALRNLCRIAPDGEDVRPWVVDALPVLLELVADPETADRDRILRLVGDLAGADRTWYMAGETLRAKRILAGYAGFAEFLTDDDPLVRDAAAYTLRAVSRLLPELTGVLWERYIDEPDPAVRVTLLGSGVITGAVGSNYEPIKAWLAWAADSDGDLLVRITALTELMALYDPPPFDAETARDTLLAAYREGLNREPAPLDDAVAPLLAGQRMAARRWTPGYPQVLSAVRAAFRTDVGPQLDLLEQMLDLPASDARQDALHEAQSMMQRLRAPYLPLVQRAAELLADGDLQVRTAALRLLHGIGEIGRPAADAVWAVLAKADQRIRPGQSAWISNGTHGPVLSPAVQILAGFGDDRVLPMLERLLDEAPDVGELHRCIAGYGLRARGLSRTLRRRLRGLRPSEQAQRLGLLQALTAVAPNETGDHLAHEPIDVVTLGLLARAGRTAAARIPDIRKALTSAKPAVQLAAAYAIWHVAGDATAAAAVYDRFLDNRSAATGHVVTAIDGLGELGIRVADRRRRLAARMDARSDGVIVVAAADALWRVAGDRDAVRRLGRVWEAAPGTRPRIARLWVETGDARYGARYARAEADTAIRHNASNRGLSAEEISDDERLLGLCVRLLA
ncbi:hypothetical protein OHA21_19310 [Actinoplanes sp. NBC_00393]|uniref:hypothetical protein n=1 Tax=Actinoplanes sp. NBC_00393 TaxID=2975953 RepID=UPI002E1BF29E